MIVLDKPIEIGNIYEGKLYTRIIEDVWKDGIKIMTIASVGGKKPGPRPINGFISLYGLKRWLVNNRLAREETRPRKPRLRQLRLW